MSALGCVFHCIQNLRTRARVLELQHRHEILYRNSNRQATINKGARDLVVSPLDGHAVQS